MPPKLNYASTFPAGVHALIALNRTIEAAGLEPALLELVKTRASQLNGCAFCIDMHTKDARAGGEAEQRLYGLSAWRETPFFTPRERAALAWTEAITNIQQGHASDEAYAAAHEQFPEPELTVLTFAIAQINFWNRVALAFRPEVGSYQPSKKSAPESS